MTQTIYFGGSKKRSTRVNGGEVRVQQRPLRHHTQRTQFDPNPEAAFLAYLNKVWVHEHTVPQGGKELATFDIEAVQSDLLAFIASGRQLPKRGSTVEELYLGIQLALRTEMICLLSDIQPEQPTARIARKATLHPSILVKFVANGLESLARKGLNFFEKASNGIGLELRIREWPYPFFALTYDGETGHAITLLGLDSVTNSIVYYDPWPGQSLLSAGNNIAGVAAIPYLSRRGERLWLIKPIELQKVVYAVVLPTQIWQDCLSDS